MAQANKKITREFLINNFLRENSFDDFKIGSAIGDASNRRYYRLEKENKSFMLMDSPPHLEPVEPYLKISSLLAKNNFNVPNIIASDIENGLLIIEDFGQNSYNNYLINHENHQDELYNNAIDNLISFRNIETNHLAKHDRESLLDGIKLYAKVCLNDDSFITLWSKILDNLDFNESYFEHRDYHADNLFWLDNETNIKRTGIIDFQDATSGFAAYDLVSLLQDARRYISEAKEQQYLNYYIEKANLTDKQKFIQTYNILGAQRNLRIHALFTKFANQGNKTYLKFLPNVSKYLTRNHTTKELQHLNQYLP